MCWHRLRTTHVLSWDVRSAEEYAGLRSGSARHGHIPGAVNLDWELLKDSNRQLRLVENLDEIAASLGLLQAEQVITHCQSHHRSGLSYLVGRLLGLNIKAFHGSWAEWGNDPNTPIENPLRGQLFMSQFFLGLQRVLPQHGVSRLVGWLASSQTPFIRRFFIHSFARAYNISLADAERKHLDDYQSFNDFFTRSLAADARPMPEQPNRLACPVDGTVSQTGRIERDLLMQAKGHQYSLNSLAGETGKGLTTATFARFIWHPAITTVFICPATQSWSKLAPSPAPCFL